MSDERQDPPTPVGSEPLQSPGAPVEAGGEAPPASTPQATGVAAEPQAAHGAIRTPAQAGQAHTAAEAEEALRVFEQSERERTASLAKAEEASGGRDQRAQAKPRAGRMAGLVRGFLRGFWQIRDDPTLLGKLLMSGLCIGLLLGVWTLVSREWWGPNGNERILDKMAMGSPEEVFGSLHSLWFERAFMRNLLASLWRVLQGFGLAIVIGVPIGILSGTFRRIDSFFAPISIFGRNVPIAALVPLTMLFFGIDEGQKVAFIFISCVAFVMFDASRAISDVSDDYLDTAYTLGASRWQVLTKVLVPLAMPDIFNSLRLLLGLAFGYIILAEMVNAEFGVGKLILMSQRRGPKEHVYLILFFLTLVAFFINYLLSSLQRALFRYRYGRS